jgi:hypothetical protein
MESLAMGKLKQIFFEGHLFTVAELEAVKNSPGITDARAARIEAKLKDIKARKGPKSKE